MRVLAVVLSVVVGGQVGCGADRANGDLAEVAHDADVADATGGDVASETVGDSAVLDTQVTDTFVEDTQVTDTFVEDTGVVEDVFVEDTLVEDTFQVEDTFVEDTFVEDTFVEDTFVEDTFIEDTFVADTFVEDTFVADTFVEDTVLVEDTFVADTVLVEDTLVEDTVLVEDTFVEDTFVEDTFVEDTFVEDTFVEDAFVEDTLVEDVAPAPSSCRVVAPLAASRYAGEALAVEGRITVPGVTDQTTGNDPDARVRLEVGVASGAVTSWKATTAPVAGWSADDPADPDDEDAWVGTVVAPTGLGTHAVRLRLSSDSGASWQICDGETTLTVVADPCASNPCSLPGPTCEGTERVSYAGPATCVRAPAIQATRTCDPGPATRTDCDASFRLCESGSCVSRDRWCRLQSPTATVLYPDEQAPSYVRLHVEGVSASDPSPAALRVELGITPLGAEPIIVWSPAVPNPGWTGEPEPANLEWMATLDAPDTLGDYLYVFRISIDSGQSWLWCDSNAGSGHDGSEDGFQLANAGYLEVVADPCTSSNPCVTPPDGCDGQTLLIHESEPRCLRAPNHAASAACDYGTPSATDCSAAHASCDANLLQCSMLPREAACHLQYPATADRYADETLTAYVRVQVEDVTALTSGYDADPDVRVEARLDDVWLEALPNLGYVAGEEPDYDEWSIDFDVPDALADATYGFRLSVDAGSSWIACAGEGVLTTVADPCDSGSACTTPDDGCDDDTLVTHLATPTCTRPDAEVGGAPVCDYGAETLTACGSDGHVCDADALACVLPAPTCWLQYPLAAELYPSETAVTYARVVLPFVTDRTSATDVDAALEVELGVGPRDAAPAAWPSWIAATANNGWDAQTAAAAADVDEYQATLEGGDVAALDYAFRVRWTGDGGLAWTYCDDVGQLERLPDPCVPNPCTTPPAGTCDGTLLGSVADIGTCALLDHATTCSYAALDPIDCADFGASCTSGACVARDIFCRLQYPPTIAAHAGEGTSVYGRYYLAGVTDQTPLIDADPFIIGAVGLGPWGSDPASWPEQSWTDASVNAGWDGRDFGGNELNNDELMATLLAPDDGCRVAFAYRVSSDLGHSWTYCDRDVDGGDGSADGYQPERAGALTVVPGPQALRVTEVSTNQASWAVLLQLLQSSMDAGDVHPLLELRPFADGGAIASHLGVLADDGCDYLLMSCPWRVPTSGLDADTCRGVGGFALTLDDDGAQFTMSGGGAIGDRIALGDLTIWNAALVDVVGTLDVYGAIVAVQGRLEGAIRSSDVAAAGPDDTDTDGDTLPDAHAIVIDFEALGGIIVGLEDD